MRGITKAEIRFWERPTNETAEEREWLARLEVVRPDMFPLKVFDRLPNGDMDMPVKLLGRHVRGVGNFGCYPIGLAWIKSEVLRLEREAKETAEKEIELAIGAFI